MKRYVVIIYIIFLSLSLFFSCATKQTNDTLTIFFDWTSDIDPRTGHTSSLVPQAIEIFELETGMKVSIYKEEIFSKYGESRDYIYEIQKLHTEIMAGKGPDVIITGDALSAITLYKQMDAGVYVDFNELIKKDRSFALDDYEQRILDAGIYKGKRYIMPLSYNIPLMIASPEKMNKYGLISDDFCEYEGLLDAALHLHSQGVSMVDDISGSLFLCSSGILLQEMIDIEKQKVDISTPNIDKAIQVMLNEIDFLLADTFPLDVQLMYEHKDHTAFEKGLFFIQQNTLAQMRYLASVHGDDYINIMPVACAAGEIPAIVTQNAMITSSSKNQDLAWKFVKILLGADCQDNLFQYAAVRSSSLGMNLINASALCNSSPDNFIEQLKWFYQNYDYAYLDGTNSGRLAFEVLELFSYLERDIDVYNISEQKEKAQNKLMILLEE